MSAPIGDGRSCQLALQPRSMPYELFLHITEYMIVGAIEACTTPDTWYMGYNVNGLEENDQIIDIDIMSQHAEGNQINGKSKSASQQDKSKYDSAAPEDNWSPREAQFSLSGKHDTGVERHQLTRLASQVNQQTRAMTHRKFLRFPVEGSPIEAWLLMEIDEFIPSLPCSNNIRWLFPFTSSLALRDTMLQPAPGLKILFDQIRNIRIESVHLFRDANAEDLKAILGLKSLEQISIRIGQVDESGLHLAQKNETIDWYFPDLLYWQFNHGASFSQLWKPFRDRNVALVAEDKEQGYWMQLFDTPHGIRVLFPFGEALEDYDYEEY